MFSSKSNLPSTKKHATTGEIPSIIAADLKIVGNLICGGSIEIEGEVEGNITCGHVTIRRTGTINGDVVADNIYIDGEVNGLVKGINITISDSGRVTGIIMYESLSVKDGAFIDGQCKSSDKIHRNNVEAIKCDEIDAQETKTIEGKDEGKVTEITAKEKIKA